MLILHDSAISRSKILMPIPKNHWMPSSQAIPYDRFKNLAVRHMFSIGAISNDGRLVWKGWFEDREDFDAFLLAISKGTLKTERALWDLPTPSWQPYLGDILTYEFYGNTFLTGPAGTTQTFNIPVDFTINNKVHCIGAGGFGGSTYVPSPTDYSRYQGGGGGGGAYSRTERLNLTAGGTCQYFVANTTLTSVNKQTWFNGNTGTNVCVAASGDGGNNYFTLNGTTAPGGYRGGFFFFGGNTQNCIGTVSYSGGNGGPGDNWAGYNTASGTRDLSTGGSGGGGAAGYYGKGGDGGQIELSSGPATRGRSGCGGGGADGGQTATTGGSNAYGPSYGGQNRLGTGQTSSFGGAGTNGAGGSGGDSDYQAVAGKIYTGGAGSMETTASYWNSSYGAGSGGGGGGCGGGSSDWDGYAFPGGAAGSYGGGGGASGYFRYGNTGYVYGFFGPPNYYILARGNTASLGGQGLIVVEYQPILASGFNSPMLGM